MELKGVTPRSVILYRRGNKIPLFCISSSEPRPHSTCEIGRLPTCPDPAGEGDCAGVELVFEEVYKDATKNKIRADKKIRIVGGSVIVEAINIGFELRDSGKTFRNGNVRRLKSFEIMYLTASGRLKIHTESITDDGGYDVVIEYQ